MKRLRRLRVLLIALPVWFAVSARSLAQSEPATSPSTASQPLAPETPEAQVAAKRAALAEEIANNKKQLEAATANADANVTQVLTRRAELFEKLSRLYGQQDSALQRVRELAQEKVAIESDLTKREGNNSLSPLPYTLGFFDKLQDDLDAHEGRKEMRQAALRAAEQALEQSRIALDARERDRRQAREAVEKNTDPSLTATLSNRRREAQLESQVAAELVQLRELELKNEKLAAELYQQREELLQEQVKWVRKRLQLTPQDLQEALARIEGQEFERKAALERAEQELAAADRRWSVAQQRLDATTDPTPQLIEEAEARRLSRWVSQLTMTLGGKQLERLTNLKTLWRRRYLTLTKQARWKELRTWRTEATLTGEELEREHRLTTARIADTHRDLTTVEEKLKDAQTSHASTARWLQLQKSALEHLTQLYETELESIKASQKLVRRLHEAIQQRRATFGMLDRLRGGVESVLAVWRYELFALDDHSMTVGTVVSAVLLFFAGIVASRFLSRFLGRRLLPRFGLDAGAAAAFQSLSFYAFIVFFTLFALHMLNVPLTVFTFFGGALAIAVGFGSQNILNNFISGLILLAERPIRVGDMIELEGTYGTVEEVGFRSTRVRSFENIHIIVPNSAFLEKNVINWTLSDDLVRIHITLGVVYGSPTREVARLIQQVMDEHTKILKSPEPIILFADFGDNALQFEVHFWMHMKRLMDRRITESDVRYRIDELFRNANIVIAFPQRDVHLDAAQPLAVRVVGDKGLPVSK